jgi:hypothetical protein
MGASCRGFFIMIAFAAPARKGLSRVAELGAMSSK